MAVMNVFFTCCSVRLGTILVALLSLAQSLCIIIIITTMKAEVFNTQTDDLEKNANDGFIDMLLNKLERDFDQVKLFIIIYMALYMISCISILFGALKLFKYMLIPYIVLEFVRIILILLVHIVAMIMLKQSMNLGELITATVAGGFGILCLLYMWACVIALYQILTIVQTQTYQSLYGHLPLTEKFNTSNNKSKKISNEKDTVKINIMEDMVSYPATDVIKDNDQFNGYTYATRNPIQKHNDRIDTNTHNYYKF